MAGHWDLLMADWITLLVYIHNLVSQLTCRGFCHISPVSVVMTKVAILSELLTHLKVPGQDWISVVAFAIC